MRRAIMSTALALFFLFMSMPQAYAVKNELTVTAQSAVLIEANTRKVLYYKSAHTELPMASTTKIMTAYVALKYGNTDSIVTTADEAYGIEGSSIYLKKNERISLNDLLYGLLLRSGNDAAVAIACHISGNVEKFATLMNEEAKAIGALNTNFSNANGLPSEKHYTTAYDFALITAKAMEYDKFNEIISTKYYTATTGEIARTMQNKNKLLFEYEGANGVKTGYTLQAGKCLVFSATRDGMTIIGVVLNCPDMFPDAIKILDYGFENYSLYTLVRNGTTIARTQVIGSEKKVLELSSKSDIIIPVKKENGIELRSDINIQSKITAPVKKGDVLGKLSLYEGNNLIAEADLVANEDVLPFTFEYYIKKMFELWV